MRTFRNDKGDVIHVEGAVADYYAAKLDWQEVTGTPAASSEPADLESFTKDQLAEYATSEGVEVTKSDTKADIITKIKES